MAITYEFHSWDYPGTLSLSGSFLLLSARFLLVVPFVILTLCEQTEKPDECDDKRIERVGFKVRTPGWQCSFIRGRKGRWGLWVNIGLGSGTTHQRRTDEGYTIYPIYLFSLPTTRQHFHQHPSPCQNKDRLPCFAWNFTAS